MKKHNKEPIDFVICWVDGADSAWTKKMKAYQPEQNEDANTKRFRDWRLLKYWFRGIENFAPWVHQIFLITDHQIPTWLQINHPKLTILSHEDILPKKVLPTFNSNAIELGVCIYNKLSEQFVLFNDDMFLLRPVKPTDFFKDGKPCDSAIMAPIVQDKPSSFGCTQMNNLGIINENFQKNSQILKSPTHWFNPKYGLNNFKNLFCLPWNNFPGFYEPHVPESLLKSTCLKLSKTYPQQYNETIHSRFRNCKTNISHWVFRDWQIVSNNFSPRRIKKYGTSYSLPKDINIIEKEIIQQKHQTICINDSDEIDDNNFSSIQSKLDNAFCNILPNKSEFERSSDV